MVKKQFDSRIGSTKNQARELLKQLQLPNLSAEGSVNQKAEDSTAPSASLANHSSKLIASPKAPYKARRRQRPKVLGWSMLWLTTLCLWGGMGTAAFLWLTSLPPLPNCQKTSSLSADIERLYCAREVAQSGEEAGLLSGLKLVRGWNENHPLYGEAHKLLSNWSESILVLARNKFDRSDFQGAVSLASQIPKTSANYAEAQASIADWQEQWRQGESIYTTAQEALKHQDWNLASAQFLELGKLSNNYWRRKKVDALTQQILTEKTARQNLKQAQRLAVGNNPEKLGQAIALVTPIDPQSYAWTEAKANLERWSQAITAAGLQRWRQGDLEGAIALVQQVPSNLALSSEAQDLVELSHARQLASASTSQWQPSWTQMWNLSEALAAMGRIDPASSFYTQAQADRQNWENQLQDLTQLQFANAVASLGQRQAFETAVEQVKAIGSDRPRRLQAQTLMAHWGQQIERIEDQPYLIYARHLAVPGKIPDLRAAIAAARLVPMGRALRGDAQTEIIQWQRQIETIEDQPMLDQAKTLAKQGKLREAIQAAAKIRSGRALYEQAQGSMTSWRNQIRQIQIAQDRPILDAATELAAEGKLSMAIDKAAQIGSGRALSGEARAAIAQWEVERQAIWDSWAAEDSQPADTGGYDNSYDGYYDPGYSGNPQ